ncbi:MAG: hypothetical protein KDA75_03825 [Planctomycetaceae bacterium]|nr:hypothetical protein [Planctomycetaceae bacterium]
MCELLAVQRRAIQKGEPIAFTIAGQDVMVHPGGIGRGKQARMSIRIEWPGVRIGISYRDTASRQNANFYMNVSGEACVIAGAVESRERAHQVIRALGGEVTDEWVKRIDICVDIADFDMQEWLVPAFVRGHFKSRADDWTLYEGKEGVHGFSLPMRSVLVKVYDKVKETYEKKPELYQLAMKQNRWGGRVPNHAVRIEYEVRGDWLRSHGIRSANVAIKCLPLIVYWLMQYDSRPLFCITDRRVDRENQHQARALVDPRWAQIVATAQTLAGRPIEPPQRPDRSELKLERGSKTMFGFITSLAAQCGIEIRSARDAAEFVIELANRNQISDAYFEASWYKKARKLDTYQEATSFPFGKNAEGGAV